jgi:steroid 5-alpha reductase family enzyme
VVISDVGLPLLCLAVACLAMVLAWRAQRRTKNAGVVDLVWGACIGLSALAYALVGSGWLPRRALVAALAGGWSLRLCLHLAKRLGTESEDGRYRALRQRLGPGADTFFFWFFQAQGALAVSLSLVFLVLTQAERSGWRAVDLVAVLLWLVSVGGELTSDRQLASWRARPENRGRTCRAGLWGFSRHPNYFFEWLHWLVYPVLGIGLPFGWALWLAPLTLFLLMVYVTGIPPTEAQSLRSRGDDYRAYQREVNAFFPGPRKGAAVAERSPSP